MAEINNLADLNKDPNLLMAAMSFAQKEFNAENIMFYFDKGNAQVQYQKYISSNANSQVNLPASFYEAMSKLAQANDWSNPAWSKLLAGAKENVARMWRADVKNRFLKSKKLSYLIAARRISRPFLSPSVSEEEEEFDHGSFLLEIDKTLGNVHRGETDLHFVADIDSLGISGPLGPQPGSSTGGHKCLG